MSSRPSRLPAPLLLAVAMALICLVVLAARGNAQDSAHAEHAAHAAMPASPPPNRSALHMRMTPTPRGDAEDSARAARIARTLRQALEPYRDTAAAVAAGYTMFAPGLKNQKVYHFTNKWRAVQEGFRFDASKPASILYTKGADGHFNIVGAMYVAPRRFGYDRLDARIPLSVARWHQHVNWCVPRRGESQRWLERRDGEPLFGPESPIATKAGCLAVGGTFHDTLLGWMVHANVFAGNDPASIWGDEHAAHDMHDAMKTQP
jgi:hypothetical protein